MGAHVLQRFQTCNKAEQLARMGTDGRALSPRIASVPLMVGTGIHRGLQVRYASPGDVASIETYAVAEGMLAAYAAGCAALETPLEHCQAAAQQTSTLLRAYFQHYPMAAEPFKTLATEEPFEIPELHGYTGRLDGLIQFNEGTPYAGHYFVREFKSTAERNQQRFLQRFAISRDLTWYMAGGMHKFDKPLSGVLLDVLVKEDPPSFYRVPVFRTASQVKRWMTETHFVIQQLRACEAAGVWPRNTAMCHNWEGYMRPCDFKAVCVYGEDERIIDGLYERKERP
jgi:hypothetical protein